MATENLPEKKLSWPLRAVLVLIGIVLPIVCFSLSFVLMPWWQSGDLHDYVGILMSPWGAWPFYPLLLYSMVCMLAAILSYKNSTRRFVIRLGLYTGIVLSLQYVIMLAVRLSGARDASQILNELSIKLVIFWLLTIAIPLYIWRILKESIRRWGNLRTWSGFLLVTGCLYGLAIVVFNTVDKVTARLLSAYIQFPILFLATAPLFWTFVVYLYMSICVFRDRPKEAGHLWSSLWVRIGSVAVYLIALRIAWHISIAEMMAKYSTLPKENPDCYIATAAAKGHERVVKSQVIVPANSVSFRVNAQLRYLKLAEMLLKTAVPRWHRVCRKVYNAIGPLLAKALAHPLLADAAYLSLKPAEWVSRCLLKLLVKDPAALAERIYHREP